METIQAIGKLLGLAIVIVVGTLAAIFFVSWFLIAFAIALSAFLVAWAFGIPFSVTENGEKIGYLRWFTYYPVKK